MDFSLLENLRDVVYYPFNFVQVLIQVRLKICLFTLKKVSFSKQIICFVLDWS